MQSFEKSVVAAVSNEQVRRLNLKRSQGGLVGATHRCKDARFSKLTSFNGASYAAGDVIVSMLQDRCGEVSAAALFDDGDEYLMDETLDLVRHLSAHSSRYRKTGRVSFWATEGLLQAVAWYIVDGDFIIVKM